MNPDSIKAMINKTTGVSRQTTRQIRTNRARTAGRRVSRGGMGG